MSGRRHYGAIRRLPSGRYQARYRDGMGRLVPAPGTFASKGDAQRFLAGVEADQQRGTFVDPQAGQITVATWSEEWLRTKRGQRANTLARDRVGLTYLLPQIGHLPLAAITPLQIRAVVDAMHAAGRAPATVRSYIGTSPRCSRRRWTPTSSCARRCGASSCPPSATSVQTVEEVGGHARVVAATKSDATMRTIALPRVAVAALAAHLDEFRPDQLVFVGPRGGLLRRSFVRRMLHPAVAAAGLQSGLTFHGLRHVAAATYLEEVNAPLRVRQHRLGHSPQGVTLRTYTHVPEELDRAIAERLDALFTAARTS